MRKAEKEAYAVRLVVNLMCHRLRPQRQKDEEGNEIPQPPPRDAVEAALSIVNKIAKHSDEHWTTDAEAAVEATINESIPGLFDALREEFAGNEAH